MLALFLNKLKKYFAYFSLIIGFGYIMKKLGKEQTLKEQKELENEILKKQRDNAITSTDDADRLFNKIRKHD